MGAVMSVTQEATVKKGRHRRFEEARALKRSHDVDFEDLFETISGSEDETHKPEHDAWADVAEEWQRGSGGDDDAPSVHETDGVRQHAAEDRVAE